MKERTADRNWVTSACRFVYGVLHDSKRLIGEAAQPQGAGKTAERRDARIKKEEDGVVPRLGRPDSGAPCPPSPPPRRCRPGPWQPARWRRPVPRPLWRRGGRRVV